MEMHSNTIFITGGTSGIGRGLAEALAKRGNRVIGSSRRTDALKSVAAANPGIEQVRMDVTDPASIRTAMADVIARFPELNVVINNAGVQRRHDFAADQPLDEQAMLDEVNTNLLGLIRCAAAFLPHLKTRPRATLINVSSGLAFVPLVRFPIYCATKAAVHSFTVSIRHQLRGTAIEVIELIPPYVATNLGQGHPPSGGPVPMPLDAFIADAMKALATGGQELAISQAANLHAAVTTEAAKALFARING
ncbi:MAG TPA: SDR family NAD(P)-dependent oxidoreductase [Tepidisphaeraceae bacterium]|nr:SDR family NAD(P)-dependent oxidoreductase [Tepidisphaeraceae bacterium]